MITRTRLSTLRLGRKPAKPTFCATAPRNPTPPCRAVHPPQADAPFNVSLPIRARRMRLPASVCPSASDGCASRRQFANPRQTDAPPDVSLPIRARRMRPLTFFSPSVPDGCTQKGLLANSRSVDASRDHVWPNRARRMPLETPLGAPHPPLHAGVSDDDWVSSPTVQILVWVERPTWPCPAATCLRD